jgi:GNAT superfamily N-acetyltransferase
MLGLRMLGLRVLGLIQASSSYLTFISVHPDYEKQGIGSLFIEQIYSKADQKCSQMQPNIRTSIAGRSPSVFQVRL